MKKLNVFGLGQHGINRVKSPVHVKDGELLSAQNATVRPIQGQLAITKRDGMDNINGEVANGTIVSIWNIPFTPPDESTLRLYNGRTGHDPLDGFASLTLTNVTNPAGLTGFDLHVTQQGSSIGPNEYLYFVTSGAVLHQWDGTTHSLVPGTPVGDQIGSIWYHADTERLYCGFRSTSVQKVAYWDGSSWTTLSTTDLDDSASFDQFQGNIVVIDDGTVFAYSQNQGAGNNEGHIKRYTGAVWVEDMNTLGDFGFPTNTRHGLTNLWTDGTDVYALFSNEELGALPNLMVFKRDSGGIWTNISPLTISRDYGIVICCSVFNDELYCGYYNEDFDVIEIWKRTAAGVWSIDYDIVAEVNPTYFPWEMFVWSDLLWISPEFGQAQPALLYRNNSDYALRAVEDAGISLAEGPALT